MKGYRFYAAMPEARGSKSASKANPFDPWTVARLKEKAADGFKVDLVAIVLDAGGRPLYHATTTDTDAVSTAIEGNAFSYCFCSVSREWLAKRCVRVPEDLARQLSPELFTYLKD